MKGLKKLSFTQLEQELLMFNSPFELLESLSNVKGGGTIDEYLLYFQSLGFNLTMDSNGNYHYNGGYNGPNIIPGQYIMNFQNSYGMQSTYNPWVNLSDGSWIIYGPPSSYGYLGEFWTRDSVGNIVGYATGNTTYNPGAGYDNLLMMNEYILTAEGYEFKLYQVDSVFDQSSNALRVPTPDEKFNCFGYAAGLDNFWFADAHGTEHVDEALEFNKYIDAFYEICSESESELVVFYNDYQRTSPGHAAKRLDNGNYSWKRGGFDLVENEPFSKMSSYTGNGIAFYRKKTN